MLIVDLRPAIQDVLSWTVAGQEMATMLNAIQVLFSFLLVCL